jgi:phosphoglycolate phosphatase-like HAD superfamily hydrolase
MSPANCPPGAQFRSAVLLDLDGVLIDTRTAAGRALAAVASTALKHVVRAHEVSPVMALPPIAALEALGVADARAAYEQHYDAALAEALGRRPQIFHDVVLGLVELAEERDHGQCVALGVVTLQARRRLRLLIPPLLEDLLDVVVTADNVRSAKPDPEGVLYALDQVGVMPSVAMFIGDTPTDIHAARRAGVLAVGAAWGYSTIGDLQAAGADLMLTRPGQIGPSLLTYLQVSSP